MNNPLVPLGEVVDVFSGFAWKSSGFNSEGKGVPIIRIQNVAQPDSDFVYWDDEYQDRFLINRGDLLLSLSGSFRIDKWSGPVSLLNQRVVKLTPKERLDADFFRHFMQSQLLEIEALGRHALVNNVSVADLKKIEVPLPPLPGQRRIAAILDKADALRAKRREAIAKLDQLLQSVFLEMFGDPATNPKRWPAVTVAEIAEVQGGLQFSASRKAIPNSVPYLRVANVQRGFLDLTEIKEMGATIAEVQRIRLKAGDILVVEGHGNPDEIGRCAIWDGSISECIHQNHLIRVRANPEIVTPSFLESYLNSDVGSRWLKGSARTTSGLNTISVKKVRETQVLLPPLALQQRWDAFVLSVAARRSVALLAAFKNTSLFEALQAQAFSGNL